MVKRDIFKELKNTLDKSLLNNYKTKFNSSSVAITENSKYFSWLMKSKTHLLDIGSEQGAIALAVANKDPLVKEVITMVKGNFEISPLTIKFLIDHVRRTGKNLSYQIIDDRGEELFNTKKIYGFLPFYKPKIEVLEKIKDWEPRKNKIPYQKSKSIYDQLKKAAELGMETHFTSHSKSLYGASVLAEDLIYFGGVYSSFDHRLSLHSEMVATLSAIMDGKKISWVGLISNKFVKDIPQCCGACRQFLMEIQHQTKIPIRIVCFSFDGKNKFEMNLKDYLPYSWDSKI